MNPRSRPARRLRALLLASALAVLGAAAVPPAAAHADTFSSCTSGPGTPRVCDILQPVVNAPTHVYANIQINAGERVTINAGGCVQTGGKGATWKRYVDPISDNGLYHGEIQVPGWGLVPLQFVVGQTVVASATSVLVLGYQDDGYSDNGYNDHDNGTQNQCLNSVNAFVHLSISP